MNIAPHNPVNLSWVCNAIVKEFVETMEAIGKLLLRGKDITDFDANKKSSQYYYNPSRLEPADVECFLTYYLTAVSPEGNFHNNLLDLKELLTWLVNLARFVDGHGGYITKMQGNPVIKNCMEAMLFECHVWGHEPFSKDKSMATLHGDQWVKGERYVQPIQEGRTSELLWKKLFTSPRGHQVTLIKNDLQAPLKKAVPVLVSSGAQPRLSKGKSLVNV